MAFGHEAVVPVEIGMGTHYTEHFNEKQNNEQMCLNLHFLAEKKRVCLKESSRVSMKGCPLLQSEYTGTTIQDRRLGAQEGK